MTLARGMSLGVALLQIAGCTRSPAEASMEPSTPVEQTRFSVEDTTKDAFSLPMQGLSEQTRATFFVGNSLFNQNWVSANASVSDRDGLGPLFNARSCSGCHFKDGRGTPTTGRTSQGILLRISVAGAGPHGAPLPDPVYGEQLQTDALAGAPREATVVVGYEERPGSFADGTAFSLRTPSYRIEELGFGETAQALRVSPRVAPATVGMGLLEAVPTELVLRRSDPEDADHDGISGRAQWVPDAASTRQTAPQSAAPHAGLVLGRFGWKAEQPRVETQVAAAFVNDMGLTSRLFQRETCSAAQTACTTQPSGGAPEVSDHALAAVVSYMRTLAVPAARLATGRGQQLFERARCQACHVDTLRTGPVPDFPQLSGQTFHPYTDLLLHDLGEDLGDARPSFAADGTEWRTAPLWGVGLIHKVNGHTFLLHDGRARGVAEAILWHGGEALPAREVFRSMSRAERDDLVSFVESL